LSPNQLKSRINEIFSAEGNTNIPTYVFQETTEDTIILIKYIDDLSFDNYMNYDNYKVSYRECLSNHYHSYYPHIDVRFKSAMWNLLNAFENQPLRLDTIIKTTEN